MSTVTLHIGDVFDRLADIPDGSVDLIVTSPPHPVRPVGGPVNLLEKLEAEQATGWPTPPDPVGMQRQRLQQLLTLLASAYTESDEEPPDWWHDKEDV